MIFDIPQLPPFEGLHPLIVHFPVALLLAAPPFLLAAMLCKGVVGKTLGWTALALLAMGTAGVYAATYTGDAAEPAALAVQGAGELLHQHEELADTVQIGFSVLTGVWLILLLSRQWLAKKSRLALVAVYIVFALAYLGGALVVANTAHAGGRLVHQFGVQAPTADSQGTLPQDDASITREHEDD